MAEFRPGSAEQERFLSELTAAGLLIASGVPGVVGRGEAFERIRAAVDGRITAAAGDDPAERPRFPPLVPREQFERSGYLGSFPHLAGTVFGFDGDEAQAQEQAQRAARGEDWSGNQSMSDLVLTPAACYPVYPAVAARGPLPPGGLTFDVGGSFVFRNEPSGDPARLQMFHQREIVRIGSPEDVAAWRDVWKERAVALLAGLGLDAQLEVASDPFFGRSGRMMAASQRQQALKFEVQVPIAGDEPTAVASFNYHGSHFGDAFGITQAGGETAHTSCLGFGLERITLALLRRYGLDDAAWPAPVREELELR